MADDNDTPEKNSVTTGKQQTNLEDFKRSIQLLRQQHDAKNATLYEQFCKDIATAGTANFQKALDNIDGTVRHFGKFSTCGELLYTMARDKIKREKEMEADKIINSILHDAILAPCTAGTACAVGILDNFVHKLQENDNHFRAEVALELKKLHDDFDMAAARKFMVDFEKSRININDLITETAWVAVGLTIEAIITRQTCEAVIRLAGGTVTKIAGSAAAPLLDGPLPIGDVIAAIGFGWCIYDIYRITKVLPDRIADSLRNAINDYQTGLRKELLAAGRKAWFDANNSAKNAEESITTI